MPAYRTTPAAMNIYNTPFRPASNRVKHKMIDKSNTCSQNQLNKTGILAALLTRTCLLNHLAT